MHINRDYARCDDLFSLAAGVSALLGWGVGEFAGWGVGQIYEYTEGKMK